MADSGDYEVGYGRPPKANQYKKGQSGYRGGRRRKRGPIKIDALGILDEVFPVRSGDQVKHMSANTTLADLFAPLFFTDSSFAIWASLSWRSKNEFDDGLAYGRQARLRRRPVDSFFSAPLVRVGDAGGTRRRSLS